MDTKIRHAQLKILNAFSKTTKTFALAGGTALELYYLKHRFSRDLDFFSPKYNKKEINSIISAIRKTTTAPAKLESEFTVPNRARVMFWNVQIGAKTGPVKIDFVEDVLFNEPTIKRFDGIPVYDVKHIYFQKIVAITGTRLIPDETGRGVTTGRGEARDIFDIYMLSKRICPLHLFLKSISRQYQRGMVYWWRSFSRMDFKLGFLDLDVYGKKLDTRKILRCIDKEIKALITGEIK